ncbi:MAG: DUF2807 domain-containing protein [Cyclobacteriaceae bacterium]|nr:DUF2807 domain-containing protein [Cyclobacteriaceae bacterium]
MAKRHLEKRSLRSSSGSAEISVSNELTKKASSSGTIYYKGSPDELRVHANSSCSVRKYN